MVEARRTVAGVADMLPYDGTRALTLVEHAVLGIRDAAQLSRPHARAANTITTRANRIAANLDERARAIHDADAAITQRALELLHQDVQRIAPPSRASPEAVVEPPAAALTHEVLEWLQRTTDELVQLGEREAEIQNDEFLSAATVIGESALQPLESLRSTTRAMCDACTAELQASRELQQSYATVLQECSDEMTAVEVSAAEKRHSVVAAVKAGIGGLGRSFAKARRISLQNGEALKASFAATQQSLEREMSELQALVEGTDELKRQRVILDEHVLKLRMLCLQRHLEKPVAMISEAADIISAIEGQANARTDTARQARERAAACIQRVDALEIRVLNMQREMESCQ